MFTTKLLAGMSLIMAVLFSQTGTAFASPGAQETTPFTGKIQNIAVETGENGVTNILVTLLDEVGGTPTVRLSVNTAVSLGLVTVDPATNEVMVDATKIGRSVELDPATVISDVEEDVHPIAAILASFFEMDAAVVNDFHEEGFGFGVITQAMWMAQNLNGDAATADLILQAKIDHDFSAFVLPDGTTPANWGQFKKAVLDKKNNLGVIVSGHVDNSGPEEASTPEENVKGNGKGKDKSKNPDKGNGKNKNP
ncbi:MAG TPA: hypothetical protein VJ785_03135 [Anaerolineales bacterium]|nr:hypothetical protein [Anaerolineales bacterium]